MNPKSEGSVHLMKLYIYGYLQIERLVKVSQSEQIRTGLGLEIGQLVPRVRGIAGTRLRATRQGSKDVRPLNIEFTSWMRKDQYSRPPSVCVRVFPLCLFLILTDVSERYTFIKKSFIASSCIHCAIKHAVFSKQRSCQDCYMDALRGRKLNVWRKS